jgi:hypothetical protein
MKTYHDLQSEKTPVEWNGLACVMLGTKDGNGLFHRMDGCPVSFKGDGEPQPRPADPKRLEMFALTGKWIIPQGRGRIQSQPCRHLPPLGRRRQDCAGTPHQEPIQDQ